MKYRDEYQRRCGESSDIADHLPMLYETVCRFPGATVVELGVRGGNSTAALLAGVDEVDGHLWSVDIAWPRTPDWWAGDRWTFVLNNDIDALPSMPLGIDVLFIDTSHHYSHTLAELYGYTPRMNVGGVVLCHDTELQRPDHCPSDDPDFPVARALDHICEATGRSWTNMPGSYGLGVMEV